MVESAQNYPLTRYKAGFRGVPVGQGPLEAVACDGGVWG